LCHRHSFFINRRSFFCEGGSEGGVPGLLGLVAKEGNLYDLCIQEARIKGIKKAAGDNKRNAEKSKPVYLFFTIFYLSLPQINLSFTFLYPFLTFIYILVSGNIIIHCGFQQGFAIQKPVFG